MLCRSSRRMIEFFTRKRMVIAIVVLTLLSVIALVIETNLKVHPEMKNVDHIELAEQENLNRTGECEGKIDPVKECKPCSPLDQKIKKYCHKTGYSKTVKCNSTGKEIQISCSLASVQERNFWIFETIVAALGILSYAVVFLREKRLDKLLMDKVNKQIAAGI